jgi:phosphatidylserine/phosphatidylglycerophosphate/cardiolipin synthase-like enzyme
MRVTVGCVSSLQVSFGSAARDALCAAFDNARASIRAEFFDLSDRHVIDSINAAVRRRDPVDVELHVEEHPSRYRQARDASERDARAIAKLRHLLDPRVHLILEDDPKVLMHCKAAVVDDSIALISTGNPTWSGFGSDGEVLVTTQSPADVAGVKCSIAGCPVSGDHVVAGPGAGLRPRLQHLLESSSDVRIATEGLSDEQIVGDLVARHAAGYHDRVLIEAERFTRAQTLAIRHLRDDGVEVRALDGVYMHEKFVDDGDEIYLGSANLTRNGIDEGREIGVVAPAAAFGEAVGALEAHFDAMWSSARPVSV